MRRAGGRRVWRGGRVRVASWLVGVRGREVEGKEDVVD